MTNKEHQILSKALWEMRESILDSINNYQKEMIDLISEHDINDNTIAE